MSMYIPEIVEEVSENAKMLVEDGGKIVRTAAVIGEKKELVCELTRDDFVFDGAFANVNKIFENSLFFENNEKYIFEVEGHPMTAVRHEETETDEFIEQTDVNITTVLREECRERVINITVVDVYSDLYSWTTDVDMQIEVMIMDNCVYEDQPIPRDDTSCCLCYVGYFAPTSVKIYKIV